MGIYEYAAMDALARYKIFLEGSAESTLLIVSSKALSAEAKNALLASADGLGYGKDCIAWVVLDDDGNQMLEATNLLEIIEGIDPVAVIITDEQAACFVQKSYENYAVDCGIDELGRIAGRNVVCFKNFRAMLDEVDEKQRAWYLLKKIAL